VVADNNRQTNCNNPNPNPNPNHNPRSLRKCLEIGQKKELAIVSAIPNADVEIDRERYSAIDNGKNRPILAANNHYYDCNDFSDNSQLKAIRPKNKNIVLPHQMGMKTENKLKKFSMDGSREDHQRREKEESRSLLALYTSRTLSH
jgi:hypothetical protein